MPHQSEYTVTCKAAHLLEVITGTKLARICRNRIAAQQLLPVLSTLECPVCIALADPRRRGSQVPRNPYKDQARPFLDDDELPEGVLLNGEPHSR